MHTTRKVRAETRNADTDATVDGGVMSITAAHPDDQETISSCTFLREHAEADKESRGEHSQTSVLAEHG